VVAKLFNLVRPTQAYFGLKDYQQVRIIEQMNEDLNMGITIIRCPTVRDSDGLARSSRNTLLSPQERKVAPLLYAALQRGRKLLRSPRKMSLREFRHQIKSTLLTIPNVKIDYIELVDPKTLHKCESPRAPALLAAAIRLGTTRLIDNILVTR
jgi:pantoate--beta-alanine ligase